VKSQVQLHGNINRTQSALPIGRCYYSPLQPERKSNPERMEASAHVDMRVAGARGDAARCLGERHVPRKGTQVCVTVFKSQF